MKLAGFFFKLAYFLTTLRFNNLKTRTAMNEKISVFAICVEAIIYLLLYNLHDCTVNYTTGGREKLHWERTGNEKLL